VIELDKAIRLAILRVERQSVKGAIVRGV